ncbi:hypothetical protein [Qipengyuania aquimaris]|uniref:hypothetical protein n=1 Tax=Qipengyuania aquimaris TaxID=255984 RepID=UPI001FD41D41|nr:hypothetical protein [Qipengyuania aquimaris]UOR14918.1 hypothetical protein LCM05_10560 [Qipengyuania aquimaris]
MTRKDEMFEDEKPFHMGRYFAHVIGWSILMSFLLIGLIFVWAGGKDIVTGEATQSDWIFTAIGILMTPPVCWALWRYMPDFTMGEPKTPRGNRIRWILGAVIVIGVAISFPLINRDGPDGEPLHLFSNSPLPTDAVWPMIALWAIAIPIIAYIARRNSDDYTLAANDFGFMLGGYLFYFTAPLWWIGWRGGLLPQPDVMIIFIASFVVINFGNLWKRHVG